MFTYTLFTYLVVYLHVVYLLSCLLTRCVKKFVRQAFSVSLMYSTLEIFYAQRLSHRNARPCVNQPLYFIIEYSIDLCKLMNSFVV